MYINLGGGLTSDGFNFFARPRQGFSDLYEYANMPRGSVPLCGVKFFRSVDLHGIMQTGTIREMAITADQRDQQWHVIGCRQMMTFENDIPKLGSGKSLVSLGGNILLPASGKLFISSSLGRLCLRQYGRVVWTLFTFSAPNFRQQDC